MDKFLKTVADQIWAYLEPKLLEFMGKAEDELIPKVVQAINDNLDAWLPKIVKTIIITISQYGGQLLEDTNKKITDIIPGQMDDAVLDPIANTVGEILKQIKL